MEKANTLNSELFLSDWTEEALDSSVKYWLESNDSQSSASVYVISDEEGKFMKIDFENPLKQDDVLKINRVSLGMATVFKTIQSAKAVISFLEVVGVKKIKKLQVRKLQGLLHEHCEMKVSIWNLKNKNGTRLN